MKVSATNMTRIQTPLIDFSLQANRNYTVCTANPNSNINEKNIRKIAVYSHEKEF